MDTTQMFQGLAEKYQQFRPGYPEELLGQLKSYVLSGANGSWPERPFIADVGAGTGISTRQLRQAFDDRFRIIGVEPGNDMRAAALRETPPDMDIQYLDGRAEALPFQPECAVLVFAAQAAHWFDRQAFYGESARILARGGALALIYNNRQWRHDPAMEAYESFLEKHCDNHSRYYRNLEFDVELPALEKFRDYLRVETRWDRTMSLIDFINMGLSTTKLHAVAARLGEREVADRLAKLLSGYADRQGQLLVQYSTEMFIARRR